MKAVHNDIKSLKQKMGLAHFKNLKDEMRGKIKKTWQSERAAKQREKFKAALLVTHNSSAKELAQGFDLAPLLEGKLQLGKIFSYIWMYILTNICKNHGGVSFVVVLLTFTIMRLENISLLSRVPRKVLTHVIQKIKKSRLAFKLNNTRALTLNCMKICLDE